MASLAISADFYRLLLYLIHWFSCPFYSSAVSCLLLIYCRSKPAGTQWGFSPCEAVWHWSRLGVSCAVWACCPAGSTAVKWEPLWWKLNLRFFFKKRKKKCAQFSSLLSLSSPFTYATLQLMNIIFRIYIILKYSWHLRNQNSLSLLCTSLPSLQTAYFSNKYIVCNT